jgi:hypothetical protein
MEIIIHVGLHKTGTTTLQNRLFGLREELLGLGILYPATGLYDNFRAGHALLPGCLEAGHAAINRSNPRRSLDIGHYISMLERETERHRPKAVIISSEVFSEVIHLGVKDLLKRMSEPFKSTKIFMTTREVSKQALSALKHKTRMNVAKGLEEYHTLKKNVKCCEEFWRGCGFDLEEIEMRGGEALVPYYMEGMLGPHGLPSDFAKKCKGSIVNADTFQAGSYMTLFLLGTLKRDALVHVERSQKNTNICDEHLVNYMELHGATRLELGDRVDGLLRCGVDRESAEEVARVAKLMERFDCEP